MENNITTPEELEALLAKKEESLIGKDKDIEDLKQKVTEPSTHCRERGNVIY